MAWKTYEVQVPGANGLYVQLLLDNDIPEFDRNRTNLRYQARLRNASSAQWWNMTNETPMRLVINGVEILSTQTGNFDVRGAGASQTIHEGSLLIEHEADGTKQVEFLWVVDPRATWHTIRGEGRVQGTYTLPTIPRGSNPVLSKSTVALGESFTITMHPGQPGVTHDVVFTLGGESFYLEKGVVERLEAYIPIDWASRWPNATQASLTLQVNVKKNDKVIDTKHLPLTLTFPEHLKPTVTGVRLMETTPSVQQFLQSSTHFLRDLSRVRVTGTGITQSYGSPIVSYLYRVKGMSHTQVVSSTDGGILGAFDFPSTGKRSVTIQMSVIDGRGRQSDWTDSATVYVHNYQAPTLGTMKAIRQGTQIVISRTWSVSSVTLGSNQTQERNTCSLEFYTRRKGTTSWTRNTGAVSTALQGTQSLAQLSGDFEGNVVYEFKAVLRDRLTTIETSPMAIPLDRLPMSLHPLGKLAVNKLVEADGANVQVTGDSHLVSLDGMDTPYLSIAKNGTIVTKIGVLEDGDSVVIQNVKTQQSLKLSDRLYVGGSKVYHHGEVARSVSYSSGDYKYVDNGMSRITTPDISNEREAIIISAKFGNDGFQLGYLPNFHNGGLCFRTRRNTIWTPWKKFTYTN